MEPQEGVQEELATSMARNAEMLQQLTDRVSSQPPPRSPRNASDGGDDKDQELGGAAQVYEKALDASGTEQWGPDAIYLRHWHPKKGVLGTHTQVFW